MQRWAVFLTAYDFEIRHISGKSNVVADSLSRNLIDNFNNKNDTNDSIETDVCSHLNFISETVNCVTIQNIYDETVKDGILKYVFQYVRQGWPNTLGDEFLAYKQRANEIYIDNGCLMWGHRVIVPLTLRQQLLNELHCAHAGVCKMKAVARAYIWWPKIDHEIEALAKACKLCRASADNPPRAELHVWEWPKAPNVRLHVDFCGPIFGQMYLVIIDAFSKWVDIKHMRNITAVSTIKACKEYFSTWGLPESIVSDNGPAFIADSFRQFLKANNIKHVLTAPYHPASNGAAENAVRTFKNKFKILVKQMSLDNALIQYLQWYRNTPHCTTGRTPSELQVGFKIRTRWDMLTATRERVEREQERQ